MSACGITISLPAGVAHPRDVVDRDHGARADEAALAELSASARNAMSNGSRRIERHLEHAKAAVDERAADRRDLLRRDAAQHGDERQRVR